MIDTPRDATGDDAVAHLRNALQVARTARADLELALAAIDRRITAALELLEGPATHTNP